MFINSIPGFIMSKICSKLALSKMNIGGLLTVMMKFVYININFVQILYNLNYIIYK